MHAEYQCCLCQIIKSTCTRKCIKCGSGERRICDNCYGTRNKCLECQEKINSVYIRDIEISVVVTDFEKSWVDMERLINEILLRPFQEFSRLEDLSEFRNLNIGRLHYSKIYSYIYQLSVQKKPYNCSDKLYQKHGSLLSKFISETSLPLVLNVLPSFELFFRQLHRCYSIHETLNARLKKIFIYLDRYHVPSWHLPKLAEAGDKFFKQLLLDPLTAELSTMALNIEYGDPDYHRVVLKLVALSHLGYLLDNNATNNPNNTYIFQPDFLRSLYRHRANQWNTLSTRFLYTFRAWATITEISEMISNPAVALLIGENTDNILFDELVVKRWAHFISDFEQALSAWNGSGYRDLLSVLCMHDIKVEIVSYLSLRDTLPLIVYTVTKCQENLK